MPSSQNSQNYYSFPNQPPEGTLGGLVPVGELTPPPTGTNLPSATPQIPSSFDANNAGQLFPNTGQDTSLGVSDQSANISDGGANAPAAQGGGFLNSLFSMGAAAAPLFSQFLQNKNLAPELLGPGGSTLLSSAQTTQNYAKTLADAGITGNLTTAQQGVIGSFINSSKAAANSALASAGLTGSSAEFQMGSYINQQAANLANNFAETDISQAISMFGLSDSAASAYMKENFAANKDIQNTIAASVKSVSSLLGSGAGSNALNSLISGVSDLGSGVANLFSGGDGGGDSGGGGFDIGNIGQDVGIAASVASFL